MASADVELSGSVSAGGGAAKPAGAITMKHWLNAGAYLVNVAITYISITGVFGETNTVQSDRYQTLLTPAGYAFSIWGPIFIWEAVFVVLQFLPTFRSSPVLQRVSPWWWAVCVVQSVWTFAFAADKITLSLILMMCILTTLLGIAWSTDGMVMTFGEWWALRACFSLHLGWIIAASVVSWNVEFDAQLCGQSALLAVAMVTIAIVLATLSMLTFAAKSPDVIVSCVAAWAFAAINSSLENPEKLNSPTRFNPSTWSPVILQGVQLASLGVVAVSLLLAVLASALRIYTATYPNTEKDTLIKHRGDGPTILA